MPHDAALTTHVQNAMAAVNARSNRILNTTLIFISLALLALLIVDMTTGEASVARVVTPGIVARVLLRHVPVIGSRIASLPDSLRYIDALVWEQRAPRVLGGALVGMLLALAGMAFQSLLMNPLADPYTVGVSSGSALGAMAVALWGGGALAISLLQPVAAFASGMVAMILVYMLARLGGRVSAGSFLLAGLNVGMFFWSLIPLMLALADRTGNIDRRSAILSELLGNLQGLDWMRVTILAVACGITAWAMWRSARELDLMTLGEEAAAHAGVDTEAFKKRAIVAGSFATAVAVSMAGIIAFVGLIVPHIARRVVGPRHRAVVPSALLMGALLLVTSDWLTRVFLNQVEVGVVTSLIGAPLFCYLLRRRMQEAA
jgi:iron complex transport system permease protein